MEYANLYVTDLHVTNGGCHLSFVYRYREGRYPENMETLTISNTSLMETKVAFCFQHDHNATTFLLEPASMTLQPGESKVSCTCRILHIAS